jgi:hypothetical protein
LVSLDQAKAEGNKEINLKKIHLKNSLCENDYLLALRLNAMEN